MSWLDTVLIWSGIAAQAGLVALLIWRRVYKLLPLFCIYVLWGLTSDSLGLLLSVHFGNLYSHFYSRFFLYEMSVDCALQFCVLVELAWSLLKPLHSSLPRWTVIMIGLLILGAGAIVWPLAGFTVQHNTVLNSLAQQYHLFLQLGQTFSILRILFFVILAAGGQLLSLSWRDRELQVATGLGFYSLVSLATALIRAQMSTMSHTYHHLDQLVAVSYFCSLGYWAVSFAQQEAARQEFTPQIRSFLLTVSGSAQAGRIALQGNDLRRNRRG